jgi:hypothetical protein
MQAELVEHAMLLEYLTCEVALGEPRIRSTSLNIPIDNNFMVDKLHLRMPDGSGNLKDEGVQRTEHNAICTSIWQIQTTTELEMFDWRTSDLEGYKGDNTKDGDVDEVQNHVQAGD